MATLFARNFTRHTCQQPKRLPSLTLAPPFPRFASSTPWNLQKRNREKKIREELEEEQLRYEDIQLQLQKSLARLKKLYARLDAVDWKGQVSRNKTVRRETAVDPPVKDKVLRVNATKQEVLELTGFTEEEWKFFKAVTYNEFVRSNWNGQLRLWSQVPDHERAVMLEHVNTILVKAGIRPVSSSVFARRMSHSLKGFRVNHLGRSAHARGLHYAKRSLKAAKVSDSTSAEAS